MSKKLLLSFNYPNIESAGWASKIHSCALQAGWRVLLCDLRGDKYLPYQEMCTDGISYAVLSDRGFDSMQRLTAAQYRELCGDDIDFVKIAIHDLYCDGLPIDEKYLSPESVWRQRLRGSAYRIEQLLALAMPHCVLAPQGANAISKLIIAKCLKLELPVAVRESPFFSDFCLLDTQGMHFYPSQSEINLDWPEYSSRELGIDQRALVEKFLMEWKRTRQSKYEQLNESDLSEVWRLKSAGKQVLLLPGQLAFDASVVYGSHCFSSLHEFEMCVLEQLPDDWILVRKEHPFAQAESDARSSQVFTADQANLHDLFEVSDAVCVFSSNVGLESLLYGKPVICGGLPHYGRKGLTLDIERKDQIRDLLAGIAQYQIDQEQLWRYLYYLLNDYLFRACDSAAFERKTQRSARQPIQTDARAPLSSDLNDNMREYLRFAERYEHWANENLVHEEIVARTLRDVTFGTTIRSSAKGNVLDSGERQLGISFADIDPGHVARYDFASKLLVNPSRILDAACGIGYGTALLGMQHTANVVGVDASASAIEFAREYWGNSANVEFQNRSCGSLFGSHQTAEYDAIVSLETIEHLVNPERFLELCWSHLRDNGLLVISVPHSEEFPLFDTQYHVQHFSSKGLASVLLSMNPTVIKIFGQLGTKISTTTSGARFLLGIAGKKIDPVAIEERLKTIIPYSYHPLPERSQFDLPAKLFTCPEGTLTGEGWEIPAGQNPGYAVYGPYLRFPEGTYQVTFRFFEHVLPSHATRLDVAYASGEILASMPGHAIANTLAFSHQRADCQLEFRAIVELSSEGHRSIFQGVMLNRIEDYAALPKS